MLVTSDANWKTPDWPGKIVHVLFPVHQAGSDLIKLFRDTGVVFEFTREECSLEVIRIVLDTMVHHLQTDTERFLFSRTELEHGALAALAERADADPWLVECLLDPFDGDIGTLAIGRNISSNPLFLTFFRNLKSPSDLDPETVIAALNAYLGPVSASREDAR